MNATYEFIEKPMQFHAIIGVQNNSKISLKVCIIMASNSQKIFFVIVLHTNMAVATWRHVKTENS